MDIENLPVKVKETVAPVMHAAPGQILDAGDRAYLVDAHGAWRRIASITHPVLTPRMTRAQRAEARRQRHRRCK